MTALLSVEGLGISFGGLKAVNDVSFTVRPGKVTGFLGPNGAGKSTTMRLVVGLESATRGHTRVNGRPYAQHRAPPSVGQHVAPVAGTAAGVEEPARRRVAPGHDGRAVLRRQLGDGAEPRDVLLRPDVVRRGDLRPANEPAQARSTLAIGRPLASSSTSLSR